MQNEQQKTFSPGSKDPYSQDDLCNGEYGHVLNDLLQTSNVILMLLLLAALLQSKELIGLAVFWWLLDWAIELKLIAGRLYINLLVLLAVIPLGIYLMHLVNT